MQQTSLDKRSRHKSGGSPTMDAHHEERKEPMILAHFSTPELDFLDHMQGYKDQDPRTGFRVYEGLGQLHKHPHFARGGRVDPKVRDHGEKMARMGIHGDNEMAIIPASLAHALDRMIGGPSINPHTKRRQYNIFGDIWSGIKDVGSGIINTVKDVGSGVGDLFSGNIGGALGDVANVGKDVLGGVTGAAGSLLPGAGDLVGGALDAVGLPELGEPLEGVGNVLGGVANMAGGIGNSLLGGIGGGGGGGGGAAAAPQLSPMQQAMMGAMQGMASGQGMSGALRGALGAGAQGLLQQNPGIMQNPLLQNAMSAYNAYQQGGTQGLINQGLNMAAQMPGMSNNPFLQSAQLANQAYQQGGGLTGALQAGGMNLASQYMPQSEGPPNPYMEAAKQAAMGAYNAYQGGGNMMDAALNAGTQSMMMNPEANPYAQMGSMMYQMGRNPMQMPMPMQMQEQMGPETMNYGMQ